MPDAEAPTPAELPAPAAQPAPPPPSAPRENPWPLAVVLAVFGVGVGFVVMGHWRRGPVVMALALGLAAALRLILPPVTAGLLVVRSRWLDVTTLLVLACGIVAVALLVPGGR